MKRPFRSLNTIAATLLLCGVSALVPPAGAKKGASQVIEGEIVLPSGSIPYHKQCVNWDVRNPIPPEVQKPVEGSLNDTFGYIFEVDPRTAGHPFDLRVVNDSDANLDIMFWPRGRYFNTIHRGGERGIVPAGTTTAYICLAEGSRVAFRYEAGASVTSPSLEYEASIADHSDNLELVGHVESKRALRRLVFQDRYVFASSRYGIETFRLLNRPPYAKHLAYLECPGNPASADVSVWGRYLFLSIPNEYPYFSTNPRSEYNDHVSATCNNTDRSKDKAGIRVVDISDPRNPRQAAFIETPCGTMNHTLLPHAGKLYIYAPIPCDEDGAVHTPSIGEPGDEYYVPAKEFRTLNMQISVIRFDPKNPDQWKLVGTPALDGPGGQVGCHDITVFPALDLAACPQFFNNIGRASLLDISDPMNPRVIAHLPMPSESTWMAHAAFTWDGNYLVLADSDRAGYSIDKATLCTGSDAERMGALWIYDIRDPSDPHRLSHFTLPRSSVMPEEPCSPWDINMIPAADPDRHVALVGWMAGGLTAIDLSDPAHPVELGHWQPAPASQITGAYFYNGRIYSTEYWSEQGLRVFDFEGFNPATTKSYSHRLNPQTQLIDFRK